MRASSLRAVNKSKPKRAFETPMRLVKARCLGVNKAKLCTGIWVHFFAPWRLFRGLIGQWKLKQKTSKPVSKSP